MRGVVPECVAILIRYVEGKEGQSLVARSQSNVLYSAQVALRVDVSTSLVVRAILRALAARGSEEVGLLNFGEVSSRRFTER